MIRLKKQKKLRRVIQLPQEPHAVLRLAAADYSYHPEHDLLGFFVRLGYTHLWLSPEKYMQALVHDSVFHNRIT